MEIKMKKTLITAVVAAIAFAAPAMAWEGKTVACYDKHLVPAKYSATKVLVKAGKKQYEHRNGHIELVAYPPVYKEVRTKISGSHYVMREVACHH
jgi:TRAP-type C4-dicarboxylate transport system substrate-binding protein